MHAAVRPLYFLSGAQPALCAYLRPVFRELGPPELRAAGFDGGFPGDGCKRPPGRIGGDLCGPGGSAYYNIISGLGRGLFLALSSLR